MGMSTSVIGFKEPDERFKKMYAIYKACEEADVDIPDEVDDFFEGEPPDPRGVKVYDLPVKPYNENMEDGYELRLSEVPKDITVIRFSNSW